LHRKKDSQRQQHEIVEVSQHRDEVRYEINRAQSIANHDGDDQFRSPWCTRVASGEVKSDGFAFERPRLCLNLALIGVRVQMVIARFQPACYAFGSYHDLAFTET